MDFKTKGAKAPAGYRPWFELRPQGEKNIVCGHWSALGLKVARHVALLDSGCVWGRQLTAVRLEDRQVFQVACREAGR